MYHHILYVSQLNTCSPRCPSAQTLIHTHTHARTHPHPPHPELAIILNPSPAWVIPDNPRLILVNSGHSSAGFHPETTETGWGLVGSWRLRVGKALIDIIGRTVIGSQEKQAQVFPSLQNTSGLTLCTPRQSHCCHHSRLKTCLSVCLCVHTNRRLCYSENPSWEIDFLISFYVKGKQHIQYAPFHHCQGFWEVIRLYSISSTYRGSWLNSS